MIEWMHSENDSCFGSEDLPVKSTDFFFSGALSTSLPNSTNKAGESIVRESLGNTSPESKLLF